MAVPAPTAAAAAALLLMRVSRSERYAAAAKAAAPTTFKAETPRGGACKVVVMDGETLSLKF
jgi:hypothetical protein